MNAAPETPECLATSSPTENVQSIRGSGGSASGDVLERPEPAVAIAMLQRYLTALEMKDQRGAKVILDAMHRLIGYTKP